MDHNATYRTCILILDFGSQYTQLIARRVREVGVYCEIHPYYAAKEAIESLHPKGIILSGGPESVTNHTTPRAPDIIFTLGCPVLGICYGMQTMAAQLGGTVARGEKSESGLAIVEVLRPSLLLKDITDNNLEVWMSHSDHVTQLPPQFVPVAKTANSEITIMADENRHFYGVQFHLEVSHTPYGLSILKNFIIDICRCDTDWTLPNIIEDAIQHIRQTVKNEKVILGLSGGVDSSVLAVLLQKAIDKNLICIFVDTGLLRFQEAEQVKNIFANTLGINLITIEAQDRFLHALQGVTEPEMKRKIIGKLFVEIFEEEARRMKDVKWLAQGTIYPDVIESAGSKETAHKIKSHHNVGGLPEKMQLKLLEPLRELFKDEVRKMGEELNLPHELIYRHPFPGPGLAVRILGEIKQEYIDKLRCADRILIEELHTHHFYYQTSQAFVVFLPVKSVGVVGDARFYDHVVALRVVETIDFMTAHISRLPYEFLERIANRIVNEVAGISRVLYDISSKPPATIEWE